MKTNIGKLFAVLALALVLGATLSSSTFAIESQSDIDIEVPLSDEGESFHGYANAGTVNLDQKQEMTPQYTEAPQVASVDYSSSSQVDNSASWNNSATTNLKPDNSGASIFGSVAAQDAAIGAGVVIALVAILVTLWSRRKFGERILEVRKF